MRISTGIPLFNTPVDAQGTENQSYNTIFDANSQNLTSHKIDVNENAVVLKAFGIGGNTITVNIYSNSKLGAVSTPMILNGKVIRLSSTNNVLVLDIPGTYTFTLSGGLGTVTCVACETGSSYWSYGLKAFATAT